MMPFVSGAYREEDWEREPFQRIRDELLALGAHMPKMRLWEHVRAIMFLGHVKDKVILDVGTRESIVPEYLVSKGASVTAIDTAYPYDPKPTFLGGFVPEIDEATCAPNISVFHTYGDARSLVYEDESFDHVLCTACLKHIPGWGDRKAVKEMARVLKPGGLLAVTVDLGRTYYPYPSGVSGRRIYDEKSLRQRIIGPSGLELVFPVDFSVEWDTPMDTWPIKVQAHSVWEQGVNLQVAFVLLRKE